MNLIQEMESTYPFDSARSYKRKLRFLKKHHDRNDWAPDKKDHEQFSNLLEKLREDAK